MKIVAYIRVSTEELARDGVSLESQREKANAYAKLYDLELVEVIDDAGESAKTLKRPGLQRAPRATKPPPLPAGDRSKADGRE